MNGPISVFITVLLCPNGKAIFFFKVNQRVSILIVSAGLIAFQQTESRNIRNNGAMLSWHSK